MVSIRISLADSSATAYAAFVTAPRLALSIVAALLLAVPCFGRIGETFDGCTKRYGKHVRISNDGGVYVFESSGFRIFAEFDDGKVDRIAYKKLLPTKDYVGPPLQISMSEIHELLNRNFGGGKWETLHPDLYTVVYECPDKKMSAVYSTLTGRLIIFTEAAGQNALKAAEEAAQKQPEAAGLEGL